MHCIKETFGMEQQTLLRSLSMYELLYSMFGSMWISNLHFCRRLLKRKEMKIIQTGLLQSETIFGTAGESVVVVQQTSRCI